MGESWDFGLKGISLRLRVNLNCLPEIYYSLNGRPGHIPTAANVPAMGIIDPETHAYLPTEIIREKFAGAGADPAKRIITYCGGGIAASSDAFALTMLGYENVAVYDASLSEWAADPILPLEVNE